MRLFRLESVFDVHESCGVICVFARAVVNRPICSLPNLDLSGHL